MMVFRLWIFRIIILAAFLILLVRLGYLQLFRGDYYEGLALGNRIRSIPIDAPRGVIFDRNGKMLVENEASFNVSVVPEELKGNFGSLTLLASMLHLDRGKVLKKLYGAQGNSEVVVLKQHLNFKEFARISEILPLPGIYIVERPMRRYMHPLRDAHLLGYVGEVSGQELKRRKGEGLRSGDLVGQDGIEKEYDSILRGVNGAQELEVDAVGRLVNILHEVAPTQGNNLYLTIDETLQKAAWNAVGEQLKNLVARNGKRTPASVIALNPNNGEILAYAAWPSFNPNWFVQGITQRQYSSILRASFDPLLNRPIQAAIPSGSTFKIITGSAGLEEKVISPDRPLYCPGYFHIPGMTFHCFIRSGHGMIKFVEAVAQSCDVYFYQVGHRLGIERLDKYAALFGIGQLTGVDLPGESQGLLPTPEWKKKVYHEGWYPAETINMSIGQGYLQITPMQLAVAAAIVANGGTYWRPHFFKSTTLDLSTRKIFPHYPEKVRVLTLAPKVLDLVRLGMKEAVDHGTATAAKLPKVVVAGKTGTAENLPTSLNPKGRNHAWFVSFAPFSSPEIVVVVMMEQSGGYGGGVAAPIAKKIFEAYFKKHPKESEDALTRNERNIPPFTSGNISE